MHGDTAEPRQLGSTSGSSGTATTSLPPPATVVPGSATTAPGP